MKEIIINRHLESIAESHAEIRKISTLLFATVILTLLAFYSARFSWTSHQVDQLAKEISDVEKSGESACNSPTFTRYIGQIKTSETCRKMLDTELDEMREIRREQLNVSLPVLGMSSSFSDLLIVFPALLCGMWGYVRVSRKRLHVVMERFRQLAAAQTADADVKALHSDLDEDERAQNGRLEWLGRLTTATAVLILAGDVWDALNHREQLNVATWGYVVVGVVLTLVAALVASWARDDQTIRKNQ